jgi:hypothetical protein
VAPPDLGSPDVRVLELLEVVLMPCRPFMCEHEAGCLDVNCPGHPRQVRDEPLATPEEAEGWVRPALVSFAVFAAACFVAAAFYGVQLVYPFQ